MGPCVEGGMFWVTCGAMVFDWRVWLKKIREAPFYISCNKPLLYISFIRVTSIPLISNTRYRIGVMSSPLLW